MHTNDMLVCWLMCSVYLLLVRLYLVFVWLHISC